MSFEKGHIPWNKGKHILVPHLKKFQFKKGDHHYGVKHRPPTMETRKKLSLALRGKPHFSMRGRIPWNKGISSFERKKELANLRNKKWRNKNPNYHKNYYEKNKEILLKLQREYSKNNPEVGLRHNKKYHESHGNILGFPNWQKYRYALQNWSDVVQKRDRNTCKVCGEKSKLTHHIFQKTFNPKLSLNINNGIALCKKCHNEVHGWKLMNYSL